MARPRAWGLRRIRYFKRRARTWRASKLRVNALASRPGRSRFAACVRPFCRKGLRARRSLRVGQRGDVAECLANRRGGLTGLSPCFRIGRIERPRAPKGLWFTVPEAEMHELISN